MPGTSSGGERLSHVKYQIVMIIILPCNRQCLGTISPAFALICQYLSSTVQDLAHSTFSPRRSTEEEDLEGFLHLHERNNLRKQLFSVRRPNRVTLLDAAEWTQGDGVDEINNGEEDKK